MDVHFPKEDAEKQTSFNACSKGNRKGSLSIVDNKNKCNTKDQLVRLLSKFLQLHHLFLAGIRW